MGGDNLRDGFTLVIPFFNEKDFIGATLASLAAQTQPARRLIAVDNGSTDGSADCVRAFAAATPDLELTILCEAVPGKASALRLGLAAVNTQFVAICDADTIYPPDYLARAAALLRRDGAVAALAFGVYAGMSPGRAAWTRWKGKAAAALMPGQAHSGGYGQSFRTEALQAAGGYSPRLWPFTLGDHEVINRVRRWGAIEYSAQHFCITSARRKDRRRVSWSLPERALYHVIPAALKDWFFYDFLAARFRRRGVAETNLRERRWEATLSIDAPAR